MNLLEVDVAYGGQGILELEDARARLGLRFQLQYVLHFVILVLHT